MGSECSHFDQIAHPDHSVMIAGDVQNEFGRAAGSVR
jgi:hypothetical protein